MEATSLFENATEFAAHLGALRKKRRRRELEVRSHGRKRQSLTPSERQAIMDKTGGRCHICGGEIEPDWTADHGRGLLGSDLHIDVDAYRANASFLAGRFKQPVSIQPAFLGF